MTQNAPELLELFWRSVSVARGTGKEMTNSLRQETSRATGYQFSMYSLISSIEPLVKPAVFRSDAHPVVTLEMRASIVPFVHAG